MSKMFVTDRLRQIWGDARWTVRQRYFATFSFVHINKTGGSSIEKALGLPLAHRTAQEIRRCIGDQKWSRRFSFAFVRNPWDKVVSHYHYRVFTGRGGLDDDSVDDPVDFATWVKLAYGENDPRYYNKPRMFMPQTDWISDQRGGVLVDFVGRYERLHEDFAEVCRRLGVTAQLPHLKKSDHEGYREHYTDETREIVRRWFDKDIETFDYHF